MPDTFLNQRPGKMAAPGRAGIDEGLDGISGARGSAALNGLCVKQTGKQVRRLSFDMSSPALLDWRCPRFRSS